MELWILSILTRMREAETGKISEDIFYLPIVLILIKVIDSGESSSGPVIRADAFKVLLYEESPSVWMKIVLFR